MERRAPRGKAGSLRWLKGLLGRPVAIEKRDGKLHLALVERRRPAAVIQAQECDALCAELRLRLLEHGERQVRVLHVLAGVHDALEREGWDRVARLPSAQLAKAQMQLLMLIGREPSPALGAMAEHLRLLQAAAEAREDRGRRDGVSDDDALIVVEDASEADYEALERAWVVTESPAEPPPR